MAYCTVDDIAARLPMETLIQITDDTNAQEELNQAVLDKHIATAGDVIESYLRQRYTLPLDPVPAIVVDVAVSLTVFSLFGRRIEMHDEPPKLWVERHRTAIRMLEQMQAGRITLGVAGSSQAAPKVSEIHVNKRPSDRVFDRDLWERFR